MKLAAAPKLAATWFEPEDQEAEQKVRFRIRPLTPIEMAECGEIAERVGSVAQVKQALRFGLLGWEHYQCDGDDVMFTRNIEANIQRMSVEAINLVAGQIFEISSISEDERKN